jgi:plasmid stabilization system protein ParE
MTFRVAPQAESDLDDIWYFLATQSSSIDVADRVIDSITARFALLARQPYIGRRRDEDLRPGLRSFVVGGDVAEPRSRARVALSAVASSCLGQPRAS